jgi:hypothetical protein
MTPFQELFESLSRRRRPEDVAELIGQELSDRLNRSEKRILQRAAGGALARQSWAFTSMTEDFARPVGMRRQVQVARQLFPQVRAPKPTACDDLGVLEPYVADASRTLHKTPGRSDFRADRLSRAGRHAVGLGEMSRRQYNKRFRLLVRMERKLATLEREIRKREYTLIGKSRLASKLKWDDFASDRDSACFIAYLTARANLRSVFTCGKQERAYDEIADMLFARCKASPTTNWWAVAHVHPDREVLTHLTDEQKGKLLGVWFTILKGIADLLREIWEKSRFDRRTMIVRKGDDSTTWNATASAWNKARDSWVALLYAVDMDEVLDLMCLGKVLRLMAADVAAWHRAVGGGLEPDTAVWYDLPIPWQVLDGSAVCPRAEVEAVCRRHGVDPIKKGWTSPRPERTVAVFRPTPELVHGVEVGNAGLALILRHAGFFSGKKLKLPSS